MTNKDILMSSMLPTELLDDDEGKIQSEIVGDGIIQFEFNEIIDNIGKTSFKETYLNFIDDVKNQSINNQRILCQHIINKIQEVYKFDFPENISINDIPDFQNVYTLVEFLEFNNINFLVEIFKNFKVNLLDVLSKFIDENKNEIMKYVKLYNDELLPEIFANLKNTLEDEILIYIVSKMIYKNKRLVSNEILVRRYNESAKTTI
ncbi:MAG TPA: hypothetical protein VGB37_14950 [Candidatus Lokiarchaeia archaeon]